MKWILIRHGAQDGAYNMALDAYMVENPPDVPVLRFYSWSPPAVSLGYNQKVPDFNPEVFDSLGIDLVLRPTGGRAVYHCHEVTYAVIIPKNCSLFALSIHQLYFNISRAISAGLRKIGIPVEIERNKPNRKIKSDAHYDCFESTARFEIKNSGRKMVGSAQRRLANGTLQHGSILLTDRQKILKNLFTYGDNVIQSSMDNLAVADNEIIGNNMGQDKIIEALLWGFESELDCWWKKEIDLTHFFTREAQFKKRYSLYRAQSHAHLLMQDPGIR